MTSACAIDCTIDCQEKPIKIYGTNHYSGGFAGYATVGWESSLGDESQSSLLGLVNRLLTELTSTNLSQAQKLLSLMGVSPSAIMGCQVYSSALEIEADGDYAGGLVGRGDALYIGRSDQAAYTALEAWNSGTLRVSNEMLDRPVVINALKNVAAKDNYAGGIAGYIGAAAFQGLVNELVGLGDFIGSSETGGLAEAANNDANGLSSFISNEDGTSILEINKLVDAVGYLIPSYINCTTTFVNGGFVDADIAGGFVADLESGTVDNTNIAAVDDAQDPKWTKTMKELYDPDAVNPTGDLNKQFAVINIDRVHGRTFGGGFGGKLRSGALANAGGGLSILGSTGLSISLNDLASVMNTYVPFVKHAGVYSENGFTVTANTIRSGDSLSGSAGGFAGYMSGAQVSHCDVYQLKNTQVNPPSDLEAANAPSYYNNSAYAVTGGHFAGGYVGSADIGDAASVGHSLGILGTALNLNNIASALSVVVTTIEHSDVQGAAGGFSAIADGTDDNGSVGKSGGYAGEISGAHIQNSHCKSFYYIIGRETAGEYTGEQHTAAAWRIRSVYGAEYAGGFTGFMEAADTADTGNISLLGGLVKTSNLLSALSVVYPTEKNTAVYGPLRNLDSQTWSLWANYVGKYGGYGLDIVKNGLTSPYSQYYYGCNVVAGRTAAADSGNYPVTEGGDAGGYVGLMRSGVISNGHSYDIKLVCAMRSAGGYAGSMQTGGLADVGQAEVDLFGLDLSADLGTLVSAVGQVFVPAVRSGSVHGWESGFAGQLEAAVVGDKDGDANKKINVNGLRSVNAKYYAGGFFGYADVTGVANVSGDDETYLVGGLLDAGEINVIEAFRPYIYYSEVSGASDGIIVRAHNEGTNSLFSETRKTGCAGGFGGAMMDGTVKHSRVTDLNTVSAPNYTGGFIGHMGKSGVVNADGVQLTNLLGATAGVFDILSTHTENCDVAGISNGAVITASGGSEPIAGGFAGYADVSKIDSCTVQSLKQVYSDEIAGGFVGKTDRHFLVSVEAGSPLVNGVLGIVNLLLKGLLVDDLENIDLLGLNLGIVDLEVLTDGRVAYINLLGLRIGVSVLTNDPNGNTGTALVTIGDSSVELPYTNGQIDFNDPDNANVAVNLIKGNRTRIENSSVKGISTGYDVYGGGAGNSEDGSGAKGMAGGFAGYNKEGRLLNNRMEYCDVVRGAAEIVGPFSGHTDLESVYSFNTLQSIEGENNVYSVYRKTESTYVLTGGNQLVSNNSTTDNGFARFDITHLAAPITAEENEAYEKIYAKWNGAKLASNASGADSSLVRVYVSNKKAVLMSDTPTSANDESPVPNPGEKKDPCEETIKLTVQKVWNDQNNKNGTRPDSIRVRLWQQAYDEYGDEQGAPQLYTDVSVIPDVDTKDGWFVISKADHARADSATWTRVIDGLPVYTSNPDAYYTYTVEEAPVAGYSSEITHNETASTATAAIVNTPKPLEIQFKYYDRYVINGQPAGIKSEETVYSMTVNGIPNDLIKSGADGEYIDYSALIADKAVEFTAEKLSVNNVVCDYDLWTKQSYAVDALGTDDYFYFDRGAHVPYGDGLTCHTYYLGKPNDHQEYSGQAATKNEKWVSYYDSGNKPVFETDAYGEKYDKVSRIVIWCYNYPKEYSVDIFGADSFDDVTQKIVGGNTVYVANPESADTNVKSINKLRFY